MNIVIVEDENTVAQRIERLTRELLGDEVDKLNLFHTLDDADDYLGNNAIDLLFLDLNLAGRDGFELLKQVVAGSFHTIVISAYAERAIEAFEYGVLDFVAKPFTKGRLDKALQRFKSSHVQQQTKYLSIKKMGMLKTILLQDVAYFQGANVYSEVCLKNGDTHLHDKSLTKLEQVLPDSFYRVHKSYIVNSGQIKGFKQEGNNAELLLTGEVSVPVSRSKIAEVKAMFV